MADVERIMRGRCRAVLAHQYRHQQPWVQTCRAEAIHWVGPPGAGVGLCGTHLNALHEGPISIVTKLEVTE